MARVRLTGIEKRYGDVRAVKALNLEIGDKEFVTLLGPSGCGKSTTLRMIAGLEKPSAGEIFFDEENVTHLPANHRDIAMVFQSYALYPHMTVYENIAFPLRNIGLHKSEIQTRIDSAAEVLDISSLLTRKPRELSGGQRQRVALGRAIVRQPVAFLLDEPLSNLDAQLRLQMRTELKRLHLSLRRTFIYVTHDQSEALTMSDKIAIFDHGDLQQFAAPTEIYEHPANVFVAGFVGNRPMNLLRGALARGNDGALAFSSGDFSVDLNVNDWAGIDPTVESITFGIRPEAVRLRADGGGHQGTVYMAELLGADALITVIVGSDLLRARAEPGFRPKVGQPVSFVFDPDDVYLFDSRTGSALS